MTAATNPLSYNAYIQTMAGLAVYQADDNAGVWEFSDAPAELQVPQMLNYAELRIQRDLDLLTAQSSNLYTLTAGNNVFALPIDDFMVVQGIKIEGIPNAVPMVAVSKEFIQNCYGQYSTPGTPKYFSMYGDTFGDGANTNNNILLGPTPDFNYSVRITGMIRTPSLYTYATNGPADTSYTYISTYYPDMLIMASMIYITMFQRNFSATSDDSQMGMNYEKQYQILKVSAVMEENRKKQQGSGWSAYSTPVSATPTR